MHCSASGSRAIRTRKGWASKRAQCGARCCAAAAAAWVVVRAEDAHCHWRSYAARYDDVRAAFGHDEHALREHYFSYGRSEGRACHDEPMEPFDFVQEHWVEIEAPLNGETFEPGSLIETTARVHQSTVPAYGNATHVSLSILVANIERTFFLRRGAALSGVDAFCGEYPPLEPELRQAEKHAGKFGGAAPGRMSQSRCCALWSPMERTAPSAVMRTPICHSPCQSRGATPLPYVLKVLSVVPREARGQRARLFP